jgi:drug/metabolite transporter (DMT)-like permease
MVNPSPNALEQDTIKAIGLMILAVCILSAMDLAIKQLVEHYPSMQVVFLRSVTSAPLLAFWIVLRNPREFLVRYPADHLLRAALGLVMLFAIVGNVSWNCIWPMPMPSFSRRPC